MKRTPEDNIILHMCTINDNHMIYGSWDMECDGQNFLSFWTIFYTFTTLTTQKIKISKKWRIFILDDFFSFYPPNNPKNQNFEKLKKMSGDIITLHMCTTNDTHIMYGSWNIKRNGQNLLSFWTAFCPFTPLTTQKIKFWKNEKKCLEILPFCTSVP